MRLPKCIYSDGTQIGALVQQVYEQLRTLTERNIDGYNINSDLLGDGLEWDDGLDPIVKPRKIKNSLVDGDGVGIRLKGDGTVPEVYHGVEFRIDADDNADKGRVCLIDIDDPNGTQLLSMYIDEYTDPSPGGYVDTPQGDLRLRRGGTNYITLASNQITLAEDLVPSVTNTYDLGTTILGWRELFVRTIDTDGDNNLLLQRNNSTRLTIGATETTTANHFVANDAALLDLGTLTIPFRELFIRTIDTDSGQNLILQRDNVSYITFASTQITCAEDLVPSANQTYDLGATATQWRELMSRSIRHNALTTSSASTTLSDTDFFLGVNTSGGNRTVYLPASPPIGRIYAIKKIDAANTLTIDANGGSIEGGATYSITTNNAGIIVITTSTGGTWLIMANI